MTNNILNKLIKKFSLMIPITAIFIIAIRPFISTYLNTEWMLSIILFILGFLTYYVIKEIDNISRRVDDIAEKYRLVEAEVFNDIDKYYECIISRIDDAKRIDTINFIPQIPSIPPSRVKYYETLKKLIKEKPEVKVSRIAAITSKEKFDWIKKEQVLEFEHCENFSLACVACGELKNLPLMTVIIIDDEVFLGMYHGVHNISKMEENIWIKSNKITNAFSSYHNILWMQSKSLLNHGQINKNNLEEIEKCVNINAKSI